MILSHRRPAVVVSLLCSSVLSSSARADGPAPRAPQAAGVSAIPSSGVVIVAGELPRTEPLTLAELQAMGGSAHTWTSHGVDHKVVGVRLDKLLAARGFIPGKMGKDVPKAEKRAGWRKVALLTARDGFQAVIGCAEMAEAMGPTVALLAWEVDGKPLEGEQGPLRLVVLTDQEPSRSIYGLARIEVLDVPSLAARAGPAR